MASRAANVGYAASFSIICFHIIYLLWMFTPDYYLELLGITYYPDRYWGLLIPIYLSITGFFSGWIYLLINLSSTHSLDSYYTVTDENALQYDVNKAEKFLEANIPPISDLPIAFVNEILYSKKTN